MAMVYLIWCFCLNIVHNYMYVELTEMGQVVHNRTLLNKGDNPYEWRGLFAILIWMPTNSVFVHSLSKLRLR